jgi:hypothetical protein
MDCKNGYHRYERIETHNDAVVDICKACGKKLVTKIDKDGRMDNKKYLETHKVDFIQKGSLLYKKFYPDKKREKPTDIPNLDEKEPPRRRMSKQGVIRETLY